MTARSGKNLHQINRGFEELCRTRTTTAAIQNDIVHAHLKCSINLVLRIQMPLKLIRSIFAQVHEHVTLFLLQVTTGSG